MNKQLKISLTALAVLFAAFNSDAAPTASDGLFFHNGDLLYGQLLAIDPPGVVRWQHPDSTEPIEFKAGAVSQIEFPVPKTAAPITPACRLMLADGDSLEGDLVSCSRDVVTLQTWYAGQMKIPRAALQSLVMLPHSPAIFDGITGTNGWTDAGTVAAFVGESGQWAYRNGAFYASKAASIARDLKLPPVAEISFDLAWKGGLNLAIALYTDSLQPILLTGKERGPDFGGFYSFRFQNTVFIDLMPIKKRDPLRSLGQLILPSLNQKDRLHVDLRVSKPDHKIALFFDGTLVKEWNDPEGFAGEGTGMRFVQNPGGIIKLSNLKIAKWNGVFSESTPAAETTQDTIWPENGAPLTGQVESIINGKLTARTGTGTVEIPLAQLRTIDFAHAIPPTPTLEAATVRATFVQGGGLTFTLQNWRPGAMTARSPDFGQAQFNPAAFTRLQFLYPEPKKSNGIPKG